MLTTFSLLRARLTLSDINVEGTKQAISIDFHKENKELQNKIFAKLCEIDTNTKNYTDEEFVGIVERLDALIEMHNVQIVVCLNQADRDVAEDIEEKLNECELTNVLTYHFEV